MNITTTNKLFEVIADHLTLVEYKAKSTVLSEGKRSNKLFYIKKGIVRGWLNDEGNETTFQFLSEGAFFCCIDSFWFNKPSFYSVSTLENTTLLEISGADFRQLLVRDFELLSFFNEYIIHRVSDYQNELISRLKDKPEDRYKHLMEVHPEILLRVPQHYIASYIGVTSVSLSRIRNRK